MSQVMYSGHRQWFGCQAQPISRVGLALWCLCPLQPEYSKPAEQDQACQRFLSISSPFGCYFPKSQHQSAFVMAELCIKDAAIRHKNIHGSLNRMSVIIIRYHVLRRHHLRFGCAPYTHDDDLSRSYERPSVYLHILVGIFVSIWPIGHSSISCSISAQ